MPEVNKVDLSKLKESISSQKDELRKKQVAMGGNGQPIKQSKKSFLNELVDSMRTGQKSEAVEVVRAVSETVEFKKGAPPAVAKNKKSYIPQRPQQRNHQQVNEDYEQQPPQTQRRTGADDWGMGSSGYGGGSQRGGGYGDDREAAFDRAFQDNNAAFDRMMRERNPMVATNPKYQQMLDRNQPQHQYQNEQYVVEQPHNDHVEMLTEKIEKNLDKMVESAFKNVLSDIYTKQKIQEALGDFLKSDDFIKVVGQAINEIAKRNKAKQAGK